MTALRRQKYFQTSTFISHFAASDISNQHETLFYVLTYNCHNSKKNSYVLQEKCNGKFC